MSTDHSEKLKLTEIISKEEEHVSQLVDLLSNISGDLYIKLTKVD
jgi:hypothetical protein